VQCQELDRRAMALGVSGESLMQAAGRAVWRETRSFPGTVVVLCGPGNNGADGFVVGRLARAEGRPVVCVQALDRLTADAARERDWFVECGGKVIGPQEEWPEPGVIVDALLGTGARPGLEGAIVGLVARCAGLPVVSVDVPTGVGADTGEAPGPHVRAAVTVTFGLIKPGLFLREGLEAAGRVVVESLLYPEQLLEQPTGLCWADENVVRPLLPARSRSAHKGSAGRVLVVAGSEGMPGAAVLAALGAFRGGAGLVRCVSSSGVLAALVARLPEALHAADAELPDLLAEAGAAVVGPGLGTDVRARNLVAGVGAALCPIVVDADALSLIEALPREALSRSVLTPHPGEAGRLLGRSAAEVQSDRLGAAHALVETFGCPVVLKGARTLVAAPGVPTAVVPTGNPGMATAGSGDVLAGLIGSLLAQRCSPPEAALLGAWLHGAAGDLAATKTGSIGLLATDIASQIPAARDKLAPS
jgi:ADP-dependent NAD(P)H-hydrate dehydratase / NAD(P)H-hydrate epimerase